MSNFTKAILGLEIFSIGTHTDSSGQTNEFTDADVDYMINKFGGGFPEFVPIKLGHTSDEFNRQIAAELGLPASALNGENGEGFDGVAALGQVVNLYQDGNKMVADLKVPDEMAKLFQDEYFRDVSCELSADDEGRWILDGLAMLGAERPAVGDLAGIPAAAVHKKRAAVAVRSFSQALPKKVNMSENSDSKIDKILGLVSGDKISLSELKDAGLKFGEDADKGAVKDAVRELQDRSGMLDSVVELLQQAIDITSTAAEDGDEIVEDDVASEPAVAAKALVGRITSMLASGGKDFKAGADFKSAVAAAVKDSTKELASQVAKLSGNSIVANYRVETEKLVGMEGTASQLAEQLADIEGKAGKETAVTMLNSWKQVSTYAVESGQFKAIGADDGDDEGGEPTPLESEAIEFRKANPTFSEVQSLTAVRLRSMRAKREIK
tara:strand:- start:942 stop:2255 length:1314 start_codon:yes stop_codon:yes gene_type:complete